MENENNLIEGPDNNKGLAESELLGMLSGYWNNLIHNKFLRNVVRNIFLAASGVFVVLFFCCFFLYFVPGMQEIGKSRKTQMTEYSEVNKDPEYKKQSSALSRDVQRLTRKFSSYTPGQSYLVINTTYNRFTLYRNKEILREGFCSSGSYTRLTNAEGSRHWIFKTPKGKFWIQEKITHPLWIRPDWSFVEEGLPIPPKDDESRYEYGVLGDYAMSLGDGYLIHGTIYKRFLGMPVTHGCVRLNDDDLKTIYNTLNIGSKVFIF